MQTITSCLTHREEHFVFHATYGTGGTHVRLMTKAEVLLSSRRGSILHPGVPHRCLEEV